MTSTTNNLSLNFVQARNRAKELRRSAPNWTLVILVLLLTAIGLVTTYTTTFFAEAYGRMGDIPINAMRNQMLAVGIGLVLFCVLSYVDYGHLADGKKVLALAGVTIVLLVAVYFTGKDVYGARRQLTLFAGISVQPGEILKLVIILYAATWLSTRRSQVHSVLLGLVPYTVITSFAAFFVMIQPDFSTFIVIIVIAATMFFVAGARWYQIALAVAVGSMVIYGLIMIGGSHIMDRITSFWEGSQSFDKMNDHIKMAYYAFFNAGIFGKGLGFSHQKITMPAVDTDSVLPILTEELGWFGLFVILYLFMRLALNGFRTAQHSNSIFGSYLAMGITCWIVIQMTLNFAGMLHLIPLPGIPVPFLGRSGSSTVVLLAACGILVSVSRGTKIKLEKNDKLSPQGEKKNNRASDLISRWNSRPRASRAQRVARASTAVHASEKPLIGRSVRSSRAVARYNNQESGLASLVRRGTNRNGA